MQNRKHDLGYRILAVWIALVLALQSLPASAYAAEGGWGAVESNELDKNPSADGAEEPGGASETAETDETEASGWNITFLFDGEAYAQMHVQEGSSIGVLPDNPEKEGFVFEYWMNDMGEAVDETYVPAADTVLYSHFAKGWTVRFMEDGNAVSQSVAHDHAALGELPADPEKV